MTTYKEKEYRTEEQFITIADNATNGNWSIAFKQVEEFGFYAQDLIEHFDVNERHALEMIDIVYLAEGGQKERG